MEEKCSYEEAFEALESSIATVRVGLCAGWGGGMGLQVGPALGPQKSKGCLSSSAVGNLMSSWASFHCQGE